MSAVDLLESESVSSMSGASSMRTSAASGTSRSTSSTSKKGSDSENLEAGSTIQFSNPAEEYQGHSNVPETSKLKLLPEFRKIIEDKKRKDGHEVEGTEALKLNTGRWRRFTRDVPLQLI